MSYVAAGIAEGASIGRDIVPGIDPGGKFIIVQSHARIPLEQVRDYCLSIAG